MFFSSILLWHCHFNNRSGIRVSHKCHSKKKSDVNRGMEIFDEMEQAQGNPALCLHFCLPSLPQNDDFRRPIQAETGIQLVCLLHSRDAPIIEHIACVMPYPFAMVRVCGPNGCVFVVFGAAFSKTKVHQPLNWKARQRPLRVHEYPRLLQPYLLLSFCGLFPTTRKVQ